MKSTWNYITIDDNLYKIIGIKEDRVLLQCVIVKQGYVPYNIRSLKIKFDRWNGYHIILPCKEPKPLPMTEVFKRWALLQDILEYNDLKGE